MSRAPRINKPHIMPGGDVFGTFGLGVPTVVADGRVPAAAISRANRRLRERQGHWFHEMRLQATARALRKVQFKVDPIVFDLGYTPPEMGRFNCAGQYVFPPTELGRAHRLMATMRRPK